MEEIFGFNDQFFDERIDPDLECCLYSGSLLGRGGYAPFLHHSACFGSAYLCVSASPMEIFRQISRQSAVG